MELLLHNGQPLIGGSFRAKDQIYDNTASGLKATNTNDAIDELNEKIDEGGSGSGITTITQEEYDQLEDKTGAYAIIDAPDKPTVGEVNDKVNKLNQDLVDLEENLTIPNFTLFQLIYGQTPSALTEVELQEGWYQVRARNISDGTYLSANIENSNGVSLFYSNLNVTTAYAGIVSTPLHLKEGKYKILIRGNDSQGTGLYKLLV